MHVLEKQVVVIFFLLRLGDQELVQRYIFQITY